MKKEPKKKEGKPLKYKSSQELQTSCLAYFKACIKAKEVPSKAGLRVHLDISRDTYMEYGKRYPDAIKKANDIIEKAWVQRLFGSNATGAIFYLKNAFRDDYKDRVETDVTSNGKELGTIALPATQHAWPAPIQEPQK